MPLTLEDGTGVAGANAYATVAEIDAYLSEQLNVGTWTGATDSNKTAAAITATRLIDQYWIFGGIKAKSTQALLWPRQGAYDRENAKFFDLTEIPIALKRATAVLAKSVLSEDRTELQDPDTAGLSEISLGNGALEIKFDKTDRREVVPSEVGVLLNSIGGTSRLGSTRRLRRV